MNNRKQSSPVAPGLCPAHTTLSVAALHHHLSVKLAPVQLILHLSARSPLICSQPHQYFCWDLTTMSCPLLLSQLHGAPVSLLISTDSVPANSVTFLWVASWTLFLQRRWEQCYSSTIIFHAKFQFISIGKWGLHRYNWLTAVPLEYQTKLEKSLAKWPANKGP